MDLYAPLAFNDSGFQVRRFHFLRLIGRLEPGVSIREAQANMDTIARQLEATYPENETWKLQSVDPGFNARNVVLSHLSLPPETFDSEAKIASWYESLLARLSSAAGVEAAALVSAPPLAGAGDTAVHREGNAPTSDADRRFAQLRYVDGHYFAALAMRVTSGRLFTTADRSGAPPSVVITEGMAREFFAQTNPVGRRLVIDRGEPTVAEVIGVVSDARIFGQASDAPTTMYLTSRQWPRPATHVVLRMATPSLAGPLLRDTVRSLDRNVAVGRIQSLEQLLHESLSQPRFRTVLAMLFASIALALTLGGLYGSVSWAVAQRTREFGIRSALGARPRQLLTLVLRQGMWIIALGALLGLAGAYICGRFVQELLYQTRPFEASVVSSVTVLVVALGTVATIVPAWRAGRIDPAVTLRTD